MEYTELQAYYRSQRQPTPCDTHLHRAAKWGDIEAIEAWLLSLNTLNERATALLSTCNADRRNVAHAAFACGEYAVVRKIFTWMQQHNLLSYQNTIDIDNVSMLHMYCALDASVLAYNCVQFYDGKEPNSVAFEVTGGPWASFNAYTFAVHFGRASTFGMLLLYGPHITPTILRHACHMTNCQVREIMRQIVLFGYEESKFHLTRMIILNALIRDTHVDVHAIDDSGMSPLRLASIEPIHDFRRILFDLFIENTHVDVDMLTHTLYQTQRVMVLKLLKVHVNVDSESAQSILHFITFQQGPALSDAFSRSGVVLNLPIGNAPSALHYYIDRNISHSDAHAIEENARVIQLLMERCPDLSSVDRDASTLAHIAVQRNQPHVLEQLINHSHGSVSYALDLNAQDIFGNTPLHYACMHNSLKTQDYQMLSTLLQHGADINLLNNDNLTPLMLIRYNLCNDLAPIKAHLLMIQTALPRIDEPALSYVSPAYATRLVAVGFTAFTRQLGILISRFLYRLHSANIPLCSENIAATATLNSLFNLSPTERTIINATSESLATQVACLNSIYISMDVTLASYLQLPLQCSDRFCRNTILQAALLMPMCDSFTDYRGMLKARYTHALQRNLYIRELTAPSHTRCALFDLPADCLKCIYSFLDLNALKTVHAARRFVAKRKLPEACENAHIRRKLC